MQPLVFKYPPAMKIAAYVGLLILVGLNVLMVILGIYLLCDPGVSSAKRAPGLGAIAVSIFMFYILWIAKKTWASIFDSYSVDASGLKVHRKAITTFLSWSQLLEARYRITPGYIELRFAGFSGVIALNNTDMSIERRRIDAALRLIEQVSGGSIRRTLF